MDPSKTTCYEAFPALDSVPTTPLHDADALLPQSPSCATTPDEAFSVQYQDPLYTEINIPLPHVPAPPPTSDASQTSTTTAAAAAATSLVEKARGRSRTLSSLSPFGHGRSSSLSPFGHGRRSSSSLSSSSSSSSASSPQSPTSPKSQRRRDDWPRLHGDRVRCKETSAMMDLRHGNKRRGRSGTVDALAIVPAVLVLSAELFTPGEEAGPMRP